MNEYYIDDFVNYTALSKGRCVDMSNWATVDDEVLYEKFPDEFSCRFEWDNCDSRAFPIMIWEKEEKPVAFWDCEYCVGYFLPEESSF